MCDIRDLCSFLLHHHILQHARSNAQTLLIVMVDQNITLFHNAQNVTITGGEIIAVGRDYIQNFYGPTSDPIPRLPPLRPPSNLFTGRGSYLQALKHCFSPERRSGRKKFLLYGMGGIGKTQICLKFIEECGEKFSDIFWIDASSERTIDLCLRQIAQKHKVESPPSAESALEWISGKNDWLMVFDNADGGYQVVEKFVPYGNRGNILVTSRDKALERITSPTHPLEVIEMGEEEAIALLLKSAAVDSNSGNVVIAAQKLVALLGGIPLAIDQAGAYIQSCGCGLDYYLELFTKHRAKLMSFQGASVYNYSTYGTWEISIEEIKHRAEGENNVQRHAAESALILHSIFALLHHDNISAEIFEKAAVNYMNRMGEKTNGLPQSTSLLDSKTLFLNEDGNWDAFQFLEGIKVLRSFSLIRNNEMLYFVHPLIQTWSRDRITVANALDCCQKSRSLLACSLNFSYQEDNYRFCTLLAPHIKASDEHAAQWDSDNQYYDDQNERFALVFDRVGDWGQTEKLLNVILSERETRLGPLHADTLTAMGNLASTYVNQGKWKEAESLQVQVMKARKEKLGPLYPSTLLTMGSLAHTYRIQGKLKEAESLQIQVMEAMKEMLEPLHANTLTAIGNLATTYCDQGRWKEAESLQVQVMEAMKESPGPLHPSTLAAMTNLASTYNNQGNWKEAESLGVQVVEAWKEKLGPTHPFTLLAMGNLAYTHSNQGKWKEAENLEVQVMEARKEKIGSLHSATLIAMCNLATTYNNQGKLTEAESLQVQVMEAMKEMLGPLHTNTLTAIGNLASTYSNQGKWEEAESLQVQVMEAKKEKLGSLHSDTLIAMSNLASTYWNQGRWKEAESLQVQVMEAMKERLGPLHPSTLTAMANLAITYRDQTKLKEARELLDATSKGMQQALGADHPTTIQCMQVLTDITVTQHAEKKTSKNTIKDARNKFVNKIKSIIPK
ncbi:hypothetical protein JOM56_001261 [Amanita muscaria]